MAWNKRASLRKILSMIFGGVSVSFLAACIKKNVIDLRSPEAVRAILILMAELDDSVGLDADELQKVSVDHGFKFSKTHENAKPAPTSINERVYFFLGTFSRVGDPKNPYNSLKTILHTDYQGLIRYYMIVANNVIALEKDLTIDEKILKGAELFAAVSQVGLVIVNPMNFTVHLLTFDAWDAMHAGKKMKWMKEHWSPRWLYRKGKRVFPD